MKIFNWLKPGLGRRSALEQKSGGLVAFHAFGLPAWSVLEGGAAAQNGYCRNPVVYRCANLVAQAAASVSLRVRDGGVHCDTHPVLELLSSPNPTQSGVGLLETLFVHLMIGGDAYLVRIALGDEVRELHILDPSAVTADESGIYRYNAKSGEERFSASGEKPELLHVQLFNPSSHSRGHAPLASAHMALDIHNAASEWNKALLDNSARPSGALVYAAQGGENMSEDQFDRLKGELEEGYSGSGRAGRPMVLEGGLDWKAMGYSPRDMDFLEAKNGAAREIALAFGVPPMLLGIPGDNTYSNYQEANRAFWIQTVIPLLRRVSADIGNWLGKQLGETCELVPELESVAALAPEREARWRRIGSADFLTTNEKREALGFAPIEGASLDAD